MEFNWKILSRGKFNQGAKEKERKNLDEKISSLDSLRIINFTSFETFDKSVCKKRTNSIPSVDSRFENQVSPQDGVQLGSHKVSLSLSRIN